MAASVSSGDEDSELSDINVTPLVDVVLVLLIVFMITIPQVVGASKANEDVQLPESRAIAGGDEIPPMTIWIRPTADGGISVAINETATTPAGLPALIERIGRPDPELAIMLKADARIPYADVVSIMDILNTMGLNKVKLETKHVQ